MTSSLRVHAVADESLGNTAYLLETGDGRAVAVDPRRDVAELLDLASSNGLSITTVLETHLHADFVGGSRELADAAGSRLVAARDARIAFDHTPVVAGDRLQLGTAEVEVIAAPGHTPEHIAFLATAGSEQALFSGGSLIAGGAARTDLSGSERTEALTRAQFATLRRIAAMSGEVRLYPTHGAGSFCSTAAPANAASTIGAERAHNPLLAIDDEETFLRRFLAGLGSYPRYFAHLAAVNRAGAPLLRSLDPVRRLDGATAAGAVGRGAWLVDGRPAKSFAREHPAGAISISVRPSFASWLGWVVPFGAPVALVLEPEQLDEALRQARRIGYDRIEGWTTLDAWREAGGPVRTLAPVAPEEAAERAAAGALLLDVRQRSEWDEGRVPGAMHVELGDLAAGKTPEAGEVLAYCAHGERSLTAASILARRGLRAASIAGGIAAWRRAGLPYAG